MSRFFLTLVLGLACPLAAAQAPTLHLEREIPLPGVEGRIDHLSVDVAGERLFVSALGNGTVEVIDVARGSPVGEIKGLEEPQGLLYFPGNKVLYVATGGDGTVRAYDAGTLALVGSISLGDDADNLRFDHQTDSIMVGYGAGAIAFLPLDLKGKVEVQLPAHPESFQVSSDGSHLIVNLPEDRSIAMVDLMPLRLAKKWTSFGAQQNFPMAVDPDRRRFFVVCRRPAQLLELNESTGTVTQRIETVADADDLFYDPERKTLYVIGGEGSVDVVRAEATGKLTSIAHVSTAPGARTGLLVPAWNKLFVAAPHRGASPARILVYSVGK